MLYEHCIPFGVTLEEVRLRSEARRVLRGWIGRSAGFGHLYGASAQLDSISSLVARQYHLAQLCHRSLLNTLFSRINCTFLLTPISTNDAYYKWRQEDMADRILTSFDYPPIPDRSMDWSAWIDGKEEMATGYGRTKAAAIEDLLEQLEYDQE